MPLAEAVRDCVSQAIGRRPAGPIRVLTHLRYFGGFVFNPVTFYYCFEADGATLDCIVAEITNTPWRERHAYVLPAAQASRPPGRAALAVRQALPRLALHADGAPLRLAVDGAWRRPARAHGRPASGDTREFDATLLLQRRPLDARSPGARSLALSADDCAGRRRHPLAGLAPLAQAQSRPRLTPALARSANEPCRHEPVTPDHGLSAAPDPAPWTERSDRLLAPTESALTRWPPGASRTRWAPANWDRCRARTPHIAGPPAASHDPAFYRAVARQRQRRRRRGLHGRALALRRPGGAGALAGAQPRPPRRHGDRRWRASAAGRCAPGTALRRNTRDGSRRNIAAHYDLGNEFFGLFLSTGPDVFVGALGERRTRRWRRPRRASSTASAASSTCAPGDHVIEIGTGWGGFALHAARHYGCHVTTTTISREQHALAASARRGGRSRRSGHPAAAGLPRPGRPLRQAGVDRDDRSDRRAVPGHVLRQARPVCSKPDGLALVQAITIEDHRYAQAREGGRFHQAPRLPGQLHPVGQRHARIARRAPATCGLIHLEDFGLSATP